MIHRLNSGGTKIICGAPADAVNYANFWSIVTCGKCLEQKPADVSEAVASKFGLGNLNNPDVPRK